MSNSFIPLSIALMITTLLGIISIYTTPALACWGGFASAIIFIGLANDLMSGAAKVQVRKSTSQKLPSITRLRIAHLMIVLFFIFGFYGFFKAREAVSETLGISLLLKRALLLFWSVELLSIIVFCNSLLRRRIFGVKITQGIMRRLKPLDL